MCALLIKRPENLFEAKQRGAPETDGSSLYASFKRTFGQDDLPSTKYRQRVNCTCISLPLFPNSVSFQPSKDPPVLSTTLFTSPLNSGTAPATSFASTSLKLAKASALPLSNWLFFIVYSTNSRV